MTVLLTASQRNTVVLNWSAREGVSFNSLWGLLFGVFFFLFASRIGACTFPCSSFLGLVGSVKGLHITSSVPWAGQVRSGQLGSATAPLQTDFLDLGWKQLCKYLQGELCCFSKQGTVAVRGDGLSGLVLFLFVGGVFCACLVSAGYKTAEGDCCWLAMKVTVCLGLSFCSKTPSVWSCRETVYLFFLPPGSLEV